MRKLVERLLMRALALVAERKPAKKAPAAPEAPAAAPEAPPWRYPTPLELDRGRANCAAYHAPYLKICRGPSKGCGPWPSEEKQQACRDCYHVHWHYRRPSVDILAAMERGDA